MSTIIRTRNSTKRIAFRWTSNGAPLDLTGLALQMIIDEEQIESTPATPIHVATITGVVTNTTAGEAYFLITTGITGTIRSLYFEVWATDANAETYPIDAGTLKIAGGLK